MPKIPQAYQLMQEPCVRIKLMPKLAMTFGQKNTQKKIRFNLLITAKKKSLYQKIFKPYS